MTTMERITTRDDGHLDGALFTPAGGDRVGAVVLVHEWHGLNAAMHHHGAQLANEGLLVLAPDLFHGRVAQNDDEAATMMRTFDFAKAVGEIGEAAAWLRAHPRCNGRVAVVGFCLGGALTLAAARHVPKLDAAVPFYGLPRVPSEAFSQCATPICGHYARVDAWADPAVAEEIQRAVRRGGGRMDLYVYDAGHAFMRATDPSRYEPTSAALAWQRTVDFLRAHIG